MEEVENKEVTEENEDRRWCVYMHTNKINGKVYIGQTCKKPEVRWNHGFGYRTQKYFWRAIKKYGWDNFEHTILAKNLTKEEADELEISLISIHQSNNHNYGYNITQGGCGSPGITISEDTKRKISESVKKSWTDERREEYSQRCSGENNPNYGKPLSEETRKKISMSLLGRTLSEEARRKLDKNRPKFSGENHPMYGKHHTKETKKKMSESHKGKTFSEEHIENLRRASTGKFHSEEVKQKISDAKSKAVVQLDTDYGYIARYKSIREASKQTGAHIDSITRCCSKKQKTALGFCWMWEDEYKQQFENLNKDNKEI